MGCKRRKVWEGEQSIGRKKKLKLGCLLNDSLNRCSDSCSHITNHSLRGVVSGTMGIGNEEGEPMIKMLVISNRFPAWVWNVGGCWK